jgi:hypothetical protein
MLAIVGTVPDQDLPIVTGEVSLEDNEICIQDTRVFVNRGTPALLAAAFKTCEFLDKTADAFMNIWPCILGKTI